MKCRRLKWIVLFVVLDLAITVLIAVYALSQSHAKTATKPLDLQTELKKARIITSTQGK